MKTNACLSGARWRRGLAVLVTTAVCGLNGWTAEPAVTNAALNVYWTGTPPVIDGKMDDTCWGEAEAAKDFGLFPPGVPTCKTEVRFAYDAQNLYVFWKLFEPEMDKVVAGEREQKRDQIDRAIVDAAEIEIHPFKGKDNWRMFIGSPLGARYDISTQGWIEYNPEWQCVAGRFDGGWVLEEKIPFGELAQDEQIFGTPQTGDQWRIQLYRKKFKPYEVSYWATTRGVSADGVNFYFYGPKAGLLRDLPAKISANLPFGEKVGALDLTVQGSQTALSGQCLISRDGNQVDKIEAKLAAPTEEEIRYARDRAKAVTQQMRFPYRLLEDGQYQFRFELASGTGLVYSGRAVTTPAPLASMLPAVEQEIRAGQQAVAKEKHPYFITLRQRLESFAQKLDNARKQLEGVKALTVDEWRLLAEQCRTLRQEWNSLAYDLNLVRLYPGKDAQKPVAFAVGTATESDKIYRDTQYQGSLTEPIRLALAGNEYGSFQLAVIPFWQEMKNVSVSFSPLNGPGGKVIPPENLRWFREDYVKLEDPPGSANIKYLHPQEPDQLMPAPSKPGEGGPAAPFQVPAGIVGAVWVDVLLPEGLPEGNYIGAVTVAAGDSTVSREIRVRSYGFDIPKRSSLANEFWLSPVYNWGKFYGGLRYTPELHAKHAAVLGRYRVSSFPCDYTFLCGQVPIYMEPDGRFTFDWTTFDKYVHNSLTNNFTAFWCSLSCNSGWTAYLNSPNTPVIERATGKRRTIAEIMQKKWEELKETDEQSRGYNSKAWFENPVYRDFLVAYVKHLQELGINDFSYYELFDEANQDPPPHTRWLGMIAHHQFFRKLVPDLHLFDFGFNPTQVIEGQSAIGLIDVWAPHLFQLEDKSILTATQERQSKHGEKFWFYTCTTKSDKEGNYTPYLCYHHPYIALRIHAWMAWHFQADGFFICSMSHVPTPNTGKSVETRWPNSAWSDGGSMGEGTLAYPGPGYELIPSMRLANVRKGLEDYEYFILLRNETKKLDPARDAKLIQRVQTALQIEPDIVASVYKWTKDRNLLESKRDQIAALIKAVRKAQGRE